MDGSLVAVAHGWTAYHFNQGEYLRMKQSGVVYRRLANTFAIGLFAGSLGCNSQLAGEISELNQHKMIDEYVLGISALVVEEPNVQAGPTSSAQREGDFSCTTTDLVETRNYDRLVAYSANSDSLWPGAIIGGKSLETGQLTQLQFDRAPLGISLSLSNLTGSKSATVTDPKLSSYRDAVAGILSSELNGATPANLYADIEEVHSLEQLSMAMGINVTFLTGGLANIGASFNFDKEDVRSRYVVKYTQSYYTVDIDQPERPSSFLSPSVTLEDVAERIPEGNPPMFVSSITYGRTIVFTFESQYSSTEIGAALDFAYRGGVDVSGDVSVNYKQMLSESKINAYILGGSGAQAAKAIDNFDALMDFIHDGGDYSPDSPGSPIAYKLNYLRDNQPAKIALTEDFVVRDCARVSQKVLVTLTGFEVEESSEADNNVEIFGTVSVGANNEGVLFDRESESQVTVSEGETWPTTGSISEFVLDVTPQPGEVITLRANLFDKDGGIFDGDDALGDESITVSFETGWRRQIPIYLTGAGAKVKVNFSLQPI
jgi:thiol-activated cytolysin